MGHARLPYGRLLEWAIWPEDERSADFRFTLREES